MHDRAGYWPLAARCLNVLQMIASLGRYQKVVRCRARLCSKYICMRPPLILKTRRNRICAVSAWTMQFGASVCRDSRAKAKERAPRSNSVEQQESVCAPCHCLYYIGTTHDDAHIPYTTRMSSYAVHKGRPTTGSHRCRLSVHMHTVQLYTYTTYTNAGGHGSCGLSPLYTLPYRQPRTRWRNDDTTH